MNIKVSLVDVRMFARHGVFEQEQTVGNEFRLDVDVIYPIEGPVDDEGLDGMISYADLYELAVEEMGHPRKLLETVAASIADRAKLRWPFAGAVRVRIEKTNPPISGLDGSAAVEVNA